LSPVRVLFVVLDPVLDSLGDKRRTLNIITLVGHCNVDFVGDTSDTGTLELLLDTLSEESLASGVSDIHNTLLRVGRRFNNNHRLVGCDGLHVRSVLR